jgi:hypothetical protein
METGNIVRTFTYQDRMRSLGFFPDGQKVWLSEYVANGRDRTWNDGSVWHVAFSASGERLITGAVTVRQSGLGAALRVCEAESLRHLSSIEVPFHLASLSFVCKGILATASISGAGMTGLWDTQSSRQLCELEGWLVPGDQVSSIVVTRAGTSVLAWDIRDLRARPRMRLGDNGLEIHWALGSLQFSSELNGEWTTTPASSPFPLAPLDQKRFFRVKVHE